MKRKMVQILSYCLVAALSCGITLAGVRFLVLPKVLENKNIAKLLQLQSLIEERFIGETDETAMGDGAASGMVSALGDEWSYYISAADYDSYMEQMNNAYVGVGMTIQTREDGYLDVVQVVPGGPAEEAGIRSEDILLKADGQDCAENGVNGTKNIVRGEEGSFVQLTIKRGEEILDFQVERRHLETTVAEGQMLENQVGYIRISNFDERCYDETIEAVERLISEGAEALLFDVRNNPGGYKQELIRILDYLLPEGEIFRSEYYDGEVDVDYSDENFVDLPMAVLMNRSSYSAAEFFAAALREYDKAFLVGEKTYGKGYFQQTYQLDDGSAVGISVGKYYTPDGENLAGIGLEPDLEVPVEEEIAEKIYARTLKPQEDPQISAAIAEFAS